MGLSGASLICCSEGVWLFHGSPGQNNGLAWTIVPVSLNYCSVLRSHFILIVPCTLLCSFITPGHRLGVQRNFFTLT